jgi:Undecaprenyl-phosphate galactose phosphotransferase WbaP
MLERFEIPLLADRLVFRTARGAPFVGPQTSISAQPWVAVARVASDAIAFAGSLSVAWVVAHTVAVVSGASLQLSVDIFAKLGALACGLIGFFAVRGHYQRREPFWSDSRQVLIASAFLLLLTSFVEYAAKTSASRILVVGTWVSFALLAVVLRRITPRILDHLGYWKIPTVIVGRGETARQAIEALMSEPLLGYEIVGQVSMPADQDQPGGHFWRGIMRQFQARFVVLAPEGDERPQRPLMEALVRECVPFALIPPLEGLPVADCTRTYFFSHDTVMMQYRDNLLQPLARGAKVIFDVFAAALLLLILSPLLLLIAAAVKLDGGAVLYSHRRIGMGGRSFGCLKFRSMLENADGVLQELLRSDPAAAAEWAAKRKLRNDPRITRVGALLRKTSLDELPQLLNVLRLEMSLVGPRPIIDAEITYYGDDIAYYMQTRPGITGLWQVSGRSDTTYAQRRHLDTWYVKNWTLWHDIAILAKTIPAVLKRRGAI